MIVHDSETSTYTKAAAVVAAAILICGGGIAAALFIVRSQSDGSDQSRRGRQLVGDTSRRHREVTRYVSRVEGGRRSPRVLTRLRKQDKANRLLDLRVKADLAPDTPVGTELRVATRQLADATRRLRRIESSGGSDTEVVRLLQQSAGHINVSAEDSGDRVAGLTPARGGVGVDPNSLPTLNRPLSGAETIIETGQDYVSDVSDAGDVNGDGFGDLIVVGGAVDTNKTSIVFGGGGKRQVDLTQPGENGFEINGGSAVAGGGDVNGDGLDDIVITNLFGEPRAAYVVFGKKSTEAVDLEALGDGGITLELSGVAPPEGFEDGFTEGSVAIAGDLNGDGKDDVAVGEPSEAKAWVLFGRQQSGTVSLDELGSEGITLSGREGDGLGASVDGVGDLNGDGTEDLAVGASYGAEGDGRAYVVFGGESIGDVQTDAIGDAGLEVVGAPRSNLGAKVTGLGDLNRDGTPDFAIGAPRDSSGGRGETGAIYVAFGQKGGGSIDVASSGFEGYRVDGATAPSPSPSQIPGTLGTELASGDVNGDGREDLLATTTGVPRPAYGYAVFGQASSGGIGVGRLRGRGFQIETPEAFQAGNRTVAGFAKDWTRDRRDLAVFSGPSRTRPDKAAIFLLSQ